MLLGGVGGDATCKLLVCTTAKRQFHPTLSSPVRWHLQRAHGVLLHTNSSGQRPFACLLLVQQPGV